MPEVSSLDFANGLNFEGFNIPALDTRRVETEVELEEGQSFAIGGLLNNTLDANAQPRSGPSEHSTAREAVSVALHQQDQLRAAGGGDAGIGAADSEGPASARDQDAEGVAERSRGRATHSGNGRYRSSTRRPPKDAVPIEQMIQSQRPMPPLPGSQQQQQQQQNGSQIQFVPMLTQPGQAPQPAAPSSAPAAAPAPSGSGGGTGANQ